MSLWRVEVAGVSHRFVEADTPDRAIESVREAIVQALDLQAVRAPHAIAHVYDTLGASQRKHLLGALDGLTTSNGLRDARRARRRLARQIKYDLARRAWVASKLATAPPIPDPELLRRLLTGSEARHVHEIRKRLQDFGAFE